MKNIDTTSLTQKLIDSGRPKIFIAAEEVLGDSIWFRCCVSCIFYIQYLHNFSRMLKG